MPLARTHPKQASENTDFALNWDITETTLAEVKYYHKCFETTRNPTIKEMHMHRRNFGFCMDD